uniref:Uncharacterized protein n=1 Tax=Alexandrium monilatum TaxID=311494 RepID=A0A7S4Q133_9DINO
MSTEEDCAVEAKGEAKDEAVSGRFRYFFQNYSGFGDREREEVTADFAISGAVVITGEMTDDTCTSQNPKRSLKASCDCRVISEGPSGKQLELEVLSSEGTEACGPTYAATLAGGPGSRRPAQRGRTLIVEGIWKIWTPVGLEDGPLELKECEAAPPT